MTAYVVTDQSGTPVSYTTVLPATLPASLTANSISDADYQAILGGLKAWQNGGLTDTGLAALRTNQQDIATALGNGQSALQAILDASDPAAGTLTAVQLSAAVRQLASAAKTLALINKRIIRYVTGDFTGTA